MAKRNFVGFCRHLRVLVERFLPPFEERRQLQGALQRQAEAGLVDGGILISKAGKVRLLKPAELSSNWDPTIDIRLTVWEMVHHLIRELEAGGEASAAALLAKLGGKAETARELCYRLYTLCERRKRATEAMSYNGLVQSWPEISRLANSKPVAGKAKTTDMFEQE